MTTAPFRRISEAANRPRSSLKHLAAPLVGAGTLMAGYLLLRPYGDVSSQPHEVAAAFADWRWVASHVAGLLGVGSLGRLASRIHDLHPGLPARAAHTLALAGVVLVLPYYGAETFALNAIGREALATDNLALLDLAPLIRNHAVALTTFGAGLVSLAAASILTAWNWQRSTGSKAAWPLGIVAALFLPQFYLPPVARMAYGVAMLVAAAIWLASITRR